MPLILPGNVATATADTVYTAANSCRFEDGDSAYMHKTPGSAGNRRIFTFSAWVKRGNLTNGFWFGGGTDAQNYAQIGWSSNRMSFYDIIGNSTQVNLATSAVFRDPSAWYHVVVAVDTTQSTNTNRVKFYINGTLYEGAFDNSTYPDQNDDLYFGQAEIMSVGALHYTAGTIDFFDGYLAEAVYIDGTQYAASDFGEFNEDSPTIWQPKDVSGLTFGTNGFYLDFEDSSNLGNDANGGTDLTETNLAATDQATDTCTNNFCTLNPLIPSSGYTFSEGNCKFVTGSGDTTGAGVGTFGLTAGKWYWEVKIGESGEDWRNHTHGIISELTTELYQNVGGLQNDTGVTQWMNNDGGEVVVDGTATTADYGELAIDDILGIAFNADDSQITFLKNGSALVSNYTISTTRGTIFPFIKTGINTVSEVNWGGCSAFTVSSAASDANGYGNFEHAPPSGYLALCSKNLGSDGG